MKVGIFGGAFDPITTAHMEVATKALDILDEVWITPCYNHLFGKKMTDFQIRLEMIKLATDNPRIKAFDYEYTHKFSGSSLEFFKGLYSDNEYNGNEYYAVIGEDNATKIDRFKNHEELLDLVPFIVFGRSGYTCDSTTWPSDKKYQYIECNIDCSSTMIREATNTGNLAILDNFLNPDVKKYIFEHKLYGKK